MIVDTFQAGKEVRKSIREDDSKKRHEKIKRAKEIIFRRSTGKPRHHTTPFFSSPSYEDVPLKRSGLTRNKTI